MTDADYDPLALPATPEAVEIPDLAEYREASFQHAESHEAAATNPELCDSDDCPHWPSWWGDTSAAGPAGQ